MAENGEVKMQEIDPRAEFMGELEALIAKYNITIFGGGFYNAQWPGKIAMIHSADPVSATKLMHDVHLSCRNQVLKLIGESPVRI